MPEKKPKRYIYGIQKHDSRNLHYDLRLQIPNKKTKCYSWAIPKGISKEYGKKRLAIYLDDSHKMEWLFYQGKRIGSTKFYDGGKTGYGKGDYTLWDVGEYELIERTEHKFLIHIYGKKIKGLYYIIYAKNIKNNENAWYIFKKVKSKK